MFSFEDQAAQEGSHHKQVSSVDSAFIANARENNGRFEDNVSSSKKRRCVSRHDVHSSGGPNSTKSSVSGRTLGAEPSPRCTFSRPPNLKTDSSDVDQVIQHKVGDGKVAHKRAEQKRRNEHSTLIAELERCLPPEFLDGYRPKNQRPGFTKNGTLEAMLNYHKHQVTVIKQQLKTIEVQAAAIVDLEERIAALMQEVRQCRAWNEPRCQHRQ